MGWTLGVGLAVRCPPAPPPAAPVRSVAAERLDLASVRQWREVPGIGARRALDLARAAWDSGGSPAGFDPAEVPGIGEGLAARARAFLAARPADSSHGVWGVH